MIAPKACTYSPSSFWSGELETLEKQIMQINAKEYKVINKENSVQYYQTLIIDNKMNESTVGDHN